MSEMLLKVNEPAVLHDLGENGFAVHDAGEENLKFFDRNFKMIKAIPLKKGEGPGEIKDSISSVFLKGDKVYLLGFMEKRLKVFSRNGEFVKDISLDLLPRDMVFYRGKLYVFNLRVNATEDSFLLGKIVEPGTGKSIKDIFIKEKLLSSEVLGGNASLLGFASTFDVGDNNIYLLISSANILFEINEDGKVVRRVELPYKERKEVRSVKNGDKVNMVMSVLDWYPDMRVIKNNVFVCFLKHLKKDKKTGSDIYRTHVIKVLKDGRFSEKILPGDLVLIGEYAGNLYLFDNENYHVVSMKTGEW
jgi:hypothetical protein